LAFVKHKFKVLVFQFLSLHIVSKLTQSWSRLCPNVKSRGSEWSYVLQLSWVWSSAVI